MNANADPLGGLKVLIVEDESLVAIMIEEFLAELGCEVAFSASRVGKALKGIETLRVDAAILDVNVAGESIGELVETLRERRIPFVLASGYGARDLDSRWAGVRVLQKPFTAADLGAALGACIEDAAKAAPDARPAQP